jgi:hypothetical protein
VFNEAEGVKAGPDRSEAATAEYSGSLSFLISSSATTRSSYPYSRLKYWEIKTPESREQSISFPEPEAKGDCADTDNESDSP